jgi:mannose-6-phosphate isomerase-like protein (cupin superfamily)
MRLKKWLVIGCATAVALLAGVAVAAYKAAIPQVSSTSVPQGFLVANSYVPAKLAVKLGQGKGHVFAQGENVYVQHAQVAPGASTGWHSHAGPVIVLMVNGALTLYNGDDKTCTGHQYGPGKGFVDAGFGHLHIARNEGTVPAEFYAVYLLPNGSGDAGVKLPQATSPNPACSFTS